MVAATAVAATSVYSVEPGSAVESGWIGTAGGRTKAVQRVTCSWDTTSQLVGVELFVAAGEGACRLDIRDDLTDSLLVYGLEIEPRRTTGWLRFVSLVAVAPFRPGRVCRFEFRAAAPAHDSLRYFYRDSATAWPFPHAGMLVRGAPLPTRALCMRLSVLQTPVSPAVWGVCPAVPWETGLRDTWSARAREAGVGASLLDVYWDEIEKTPGKWDFASFDTTYNRLRDAVGGNLIARVHRCPKWASSRVVTRNRRGRSLADTVVTCAPRNLFAPVTSDTNFFARFTVRLVHHCDMLDSAAGRTRLQSFEWGNESNDTCTDESYLDRGVTGWWPRPNLQYKLSGDARGLCSLYVRYAEVGTAAARSVPGHSRDRFIIGGVSQVSATAPAWPFLVAGREWIRLCYDLAARPFWTDVSAHPYQDWHGDFREDDYEAEAMILRNIVGRRGHGLVNTEIGWSKQDASRAMAASNLCRTLVVSHAARMLDGGGYDQVLWFIFREVKRDFGHHGMMDSGMIRRYESFYAYRHTAGTLVGKRLRRRLHIPRTNVDARVRIYEFEDSVGLRIWVCWHADGGVTDVRLPIRTDDFGVDYLDHGDRPPMARAQLTSYGWLKVGLSTRPVFITEVGEPRRPDLVVDSIIVEPQRPRAGDFVSGAAWVRNIGSAAPRAFSIEVEVDGRATATGTYNGRLPPGGQALVRVAGVRLPRDHRQSVLVSLSVNPDAHFVELDRDNNTGYGLIEF